MSQQPTASTGVTLKVVETMDPLPTENCILAIGSGIPLRRIIKIEQSDRPQYFTVTLETYTTALFASDDLEPNSAVVARKGGEWEVLCWPENGEYASSTYFVTDDVEPRLNIARHQPKHDAFALFSDGVGDLALSHLEQAAHALFFDPMIGPVDAASDEGHLVELSAKLATYLAGPAVCERTDDDKTLILISGR